ncbi:hypothetical protein AB0B27_22185 [Micromonospora rifamycinica]|uniref:hypothetical protein n=1 Tax=Micromonospora rifamycinica TaxID=291594 RepID=UPI0033C19287
MTHPAANPRHPNGSERLVGGPPRWQILYERMAALQDGELLPYKEMATLLGLDLTNTSHYQVTLASARKAAEKLRADGKKVCRLVRRQGYEVASPGQAIELARRHQSRAVAEVHAGHTTIETIDRSKLDVTTARLVEAMAIGFTRQHLMMRQLDVRQTRLETAMAALTASTQGTATRVEETAARVGVAEDGINDLTRRVNDLARTIGHPGPQPSFLPPTYGG